MTIKLSLGAIERARLVLRGGSVLDWRRLAVTSLEECSAIIRANGLDPEDEADRLYLREIRRTAVDYLEKNMGIAFAPEIVNVPSESHLILLASGRNAEIRRQACMVLKVMHVVNHIEARELKSRLNISDRELYLLVEEKTSCIIAEMKGKGYRIVDFQSSRKTQDAIITKMLIKKQGNRSLLYDLIRFRIVTATIDEIVPVVAYLSQHLFPFHYTVPGESQNTIFEFKDFIRRHPRVSKMIGEFQVDLKYENEMRGPSNPDTSKTFRAASFIVDLPLRLDDGQLRLWAPAFDPPSRVVHALTEFQIMDKASSTTNEQGEASHDRYKARRMAKVKKRLLRGTMTWKGKDSV
jgi:uncharacterized protein (TIGR04552 family)